jgi:uncharacterized RDD family membrane protein YckC
MLPEKRAFLIRGDDGQEYGPVGLEELREWVEENRAGLGTTVCLDEPGATWKPWQAYPELVAMLAEIQGANFSMTPAGTIPAPIGRRFLACLLDLLLCYFLVSPILAVFVSLTVPDWEAKTFAYLRDPQGPQDPQFINYLLVGHLIFYIVITLYMSGFHAAHGQTPAKALLRLRVIDQNGQKPAFLMSVVRGFGFIVSLVYLCALPFFYAFFNPQRRTVHDVIAGTYVVNA